MESWFWVKRELPIKRGGLGARFLIGKRWESMGNVFGILKETHALIMGFDVRDCGPFNNNNNNR